MTEHGEQIVLALNSGSSSLKYGLYRIDVGRPALLAGGTIETTDDQGTSVGIIVAELARANTPAPTVLAHRIVHGGPHRTAHCLIDKAAMQDLETACAFAPLHGPAALALIRIAVMRFPTIPQVACLDTAFHSTMPDVATTLPIPREYRADGIRRYGFHGLSCESIVRQLELALPARLVIAHLGSGASITAVRDGRSIDNSMGLTPSGGVVMATRTGDIDPGVLLYLLREKKLEIATLASMVDRASGMLAVSGQSGDMRRLRAAAASDEASALSIRLFERSVSKMIAQMVTSLGGVDMIVLTGGIGENDAGTGRAIRADLAWIAGVEIRTMQSREDEEIALAAVSLA